MKNKTRSLIALLLVLCIVLALGACGKKEEENVASDIVNGDFEDTSGKWVGWTKEDAAFNVRGVISDEKINGIPMEKSGNQYFSGAKGGNPVMKGTLTSDVFKLGGNGFITFKIGAGKDPEKCYVEFIESGSDTVLAKVGNTDCDGLFISEHLLTKVVDLSAHIGKNIYIKITDNDDGDDLAYINVDAFKVCQSDDEVAAAQAEYAKQIETYGEKPFVEDETATTIENGGFETGDLTGWKTLEGKAITVAGIVPTSQYYWTDRSVYGDGNYYFDGSNNGAIAENLTGAIRSQKFTLAGDGFITFMMGCGNGGSYVALCDGNTDEELIKVENTYFNDPARALTLLRMYMDASAYIGKVVYLKVVDANDGSSGGFAFICVDDFRVSMTRDEVAALEVEQMEKINAETYTSATYNDLATLRDYYNNYPYPVPLQSLTFTGYAANQVVDCGTMNLNDCLGDVSATFGSDTVSDIAVTKVVTPDGTELTSGFEAVDMSAPGAYTVTYTASHNGKTADATFTVLAVADHNNVPNGGFETGDLTGWTVLTEGWAMTDGKPNGVISADKWWGEELPYNQAGSYHLDGWSNGFAEPDGWQIRSANFTLAGSGFISVRMGGAAAAVRVYKADGTEIGYYKQTRFSDSNFPHIGQGGSWADMGTYVMDLSQYVGQELYVVLCDEVISGGWAQAFFDELVTYYETAPDVATMADTVMDGHTAEEQPMEIQIPWQLATNMTSGGEQPSEQPGEENPGQETPETPAEPTAEIVNGGFETGDLTGWTVLTEGWKMENGKPAGVIGDATYWGEELPYNQAGSYHLDGWANGLAEPDGWQIRSSNFILSGSGFISVRMGGNAAAVRVYKADGTEIGYYKQTRFSDVSFPHVGQGGSWGDMGTYVMDLSQYVGEELYIVLCDEVIEGGWAQAFFDEVVTYYETAPDYANMADTVMDGHTAEEQPAEIQIPWQLAANLD